MNFIRSDDENNLVSKDQPEEIVEFFKILYILLKEPFEDIPRERLILNIKENLFVKYESENFRKSFNPRELDPE